MSPALLVKGILWGLPAWGATGLAFHYVLGQVVGETSLATALFIYTFSILVGGLSFLPGGLGSAEATMIGLLLMHGAGHPQAVAVTIFTRLVTLWFAVALGVWSLSGHSAPASVPGTSNAD